MKKKIFIFTCSRADYNPLQSVISSFSKSKKYETYIIISGQHLDFKSGNTIQEIKQNHKLKFFKLKYPEKIRTELNITISKSILMKKLSKIFQKHKPDLLVLLGDRYELLPCAVSCVQFKNTYCTYTWR